MKLYELVYWPDFQDYMEFDGYKENTADANDFVEDGVSAVFMDIVWKRKIDNILEDHEGKRETIRHTMSAILHDNGATEDNPMWINCILEYDPEAQGLSSLEKPCIISTFETTDGIIFFNFEGYNEPVEFDILYTENLVEVLEKMQELKEINARIDKRIDGFWRDILRWDKGYPDKYAIANGTHYTIGEEDSKGFRGFGGAKVKIKFFDGREVISTNLWHNGEVPDKEVFPDNATLEWLH